MLSGKKLLILGSDFATYDLAVTAKKMGVYVIATDLMATSPTKTAADEAWQISTTDLSSLEQKILERQISGVIAGASELNVEMCRALAKKLQLPLYCANDGAWAASRDKRRFKEACHRYGVPVATDFHLSSALTPQELATVKYPVVVKPVDCCGNRGVSFCDNATALKKAYRLARSCSANPDIIVERRLTGQEFTGYYLLADGKAELSYYTCCHHQPGELSNIYSLEDIATLHLKQYQKEVDVNLCRLFHGIGCTDGIAWIECMYDQDGHFYVLEMGYRFAGPALYVMHEKISGFDTLRWMVECALGVKHPRSALPGLSPAFRECVASYNLFTNQADTVATVEGLEELRQMPDLILDFPKGVGAELRDHASVATVRIFAKNADELCSAVARVNRTLSIKNSAGKNLYIRYTDFDALKAEYTAGQREFFGK